MGIYNPSLNITISFVHDDFIKWKHFPRYWPFVRGIHWSPVNSPHKGQWRGALMFSLIFTRINGWVNNRKAGDLRRNRAHYDVSVMRDFENNCMYILHAIVSIDDTPWFNCSRGMSATNILSQFLTQYIPQIMHLVHVFLWFVVVIGAGPFFTSPSVELRWQFLIHCPWYMWQ